MSWSSLYQPSQLLNRARARAVGSDREMSDFTMIRGLCRHLRPLCSNQGYPAHQSHHMLSCGASNHTQGHRGGTRAPDHGKIRTFSCPSRRRVLWPWPAAGWDVRGYSSSHMSGHDPDMAPWRPSDGDRACTRAGMPSSSHDSLRDSCSAARELPRKPDIQLPQGYADAIFVYNPGLG